MSADPLPSTGSQLHVVDLDGKPQQGLAYEVKKPDGGTGRGKVDKDGRGKVESSKPGAFTVSFPDLDGEDWDGDGAQPLAGERNETAKVTATSEDRVPLLARERGFLDWHTVWEFAGNAALKNLRENPNVLWDGDKLAISSKLKRIAQVAGGSAEYVVKQASGRVVTFRLLDFDHEPFAGIRYLAKAMHPDINRGVVPKDGWLTLAVLPDAKKLAIELFVSPNSDDEPLEMEFEIQEQALGDSVAHKHQRLLNLGMTSGVPEGESDESADAAALAVARYRSLVGDDQAEDADVLDQAVTVHDDSGGGGER